MKLYKTYLAPEKNNSLDFYLTYFDKKTDKLEDLIQLKNDYHFKAYVDSKKSTNMDFVGHGYIRCGFAINHKAKEFLNTLDLPKHKTFPIEVFFYPENENEPDIKDDSREKMYEYFVLTEYIEEGFNEEDTPSKDLFVSKYKNGFYQLYCSEKFFKTYKKYKLTGLLFNEVGIDYHNSNLETKNTIKKIDNQLTNPNLESIITQWLTQAIEENNQFELAKGVYFNILELPNKSYGIHVYGTNAFSVDDEDWALDEEIEFSSNYCDLTGTAVDGKPWEEVMKIVKNHIYTVINKHSFAAFSGIGFPDSEVEYFVV